MRSVDVAVIGGGIIGTSAAAFLAEAGQSVALFEREQVAAGASGRNSGAIQRPLDPPLGDLYCSTLKLYRELTAADAGFALSERAVGLLIVSPDHIALEAVGDAIRRTTPDLRPEVIPAPDLQVLEPHLAANLSACRLQTGYPVAPAAATLAFAQRAVNAGATIETADARPMTDGGGRVTGVEAGSLRVPASQVLLAAGPWTSALVEPWIETAPIRPLWGVVVGVELADAPQHVIEELGIDSGAGASERLFSLVTANSATSVGSIFVKTRPEPEAVAPAIIERAARFVPALNHARRVGVRTCARPLSMDGRPLIGPLPGTDGLFICAGHGPWGISTGPASARLVVDQMLGRSGTTSDFDPARALQWSQAQQT